MSGVGKKDPESSQKKGAAQEVSPAEAIPFKDKDSAATQEDVGLRRDRASTRCTLDRWSSRRLRKFFPELDPVDYPKLRNKLNDAEYPMRTGRRGKCVIFNYRDFQADTLRMKRTGTDEDVREISLRFGELGFEIITHNNLTWETTIMELANHGDDDYTLDDCFVCWILTHGENGALYTIDGDKLDLANVVRPFFGNPGLQGKPKLFFIQACGGDHVGVQKPNLDSSARSITSGVPTYTDILVACSTIPGYLSWRNGGSGSLFVQAFCSVLETSTGSEELFDMLMEAYRVVALSYKMNHREHYCIFGMDMMPYITSTLVRPVRFPRKL